MQQMDFEMRLYGTDENIAAFEKDFWYEYNYGDFWKSPIERGSDRMRYGGVIPWSIQDFLFDELPLLQALKDHGLIAEIWGVDHDDGTRDHYIIDKGEIVLEDTCIPSYTFMDEHELNALIGSERPAQAEARALSEASIEGKRAFVIEAKEVLAREYTVIADSVEEAKAIVLGACDEGLVNYEDGEIPNNRWEVSAQDPRIPSDGNVLLLDNGEIVLFDDFNERIGSAPFEAEERFEQSPSLNDIAKQAAENRDENKDAEPIQKEHDAR